MKFIKYFFGDLPDTIAGASDIRDILNSPKTDAILSTVAEGNDTHKNKYTDFLEEAGILRITEKGSFCFACPVFFEKDLCTLKEITVSYADRIAETILGRSEEYRAIVAPLCGTYDASTHLYHLLCGGVFDGCFFERLAAADIITTSKIHPSGADYLPVIYEDSPALTTFSASQLCSYNRLTAKAGTFSSFGDANGERRDLYRWYRRLSQNKETHYCAPEGISLQDLRNELAESYVSALNGVKPEPKYIEIFRYFGYMENDTPSVPFYHFEQKSEIVSRLDELTSELVIDKMKKALSGIATATELTVTAHGVPAADVANEIYHLLFGQINEALVRGGLAAAPEFRHGEGRYLKCFEIY